MPPALWGIISLPYVAQICFYIGEALSQDSGENSNFPLSPLPWLYPRMLSKSVLSLCSVIQKQPVQDLLLK